MSLTTTPETYKPKYNPDKDEYNDDAEGTGNYFRES